MPKIETWGKIDSSINKFLSPLTPDELYRIIVEEAIQLIGAKYGSLVVPEEGQLKRAFSNMPLADKLKISKNGYSYQAFREKKALVRNVSFEPGIHPDIKKLGINSTIFIPLSNADKSIGVLIINSERIEQYTKRELSLLKLFGSIASMAIRKAQLYSEINRALKGKDLLISMAAHELRTPLTTIGGYIQLLHNKIPKNDSNESRWVYLLKWEITRLTQLVHELLEVNRIKAGKFNYDFREVSLKTLVNRAISVFQFTHPNREIILKDSLSGKADIVIGDFDKLLQILTNLVDNAVKFSPQHTPIRLQLSSRASYIEVSVQDYGEGIPKKDLFRIFEDFYRGNYHTHEGMGLGLFLVKNIVDQHNGTIQIRSRLNKGTTIRIRLPRVKL